MRTAKQEGYIFETPIVVQSTDIDDNGHVNNVVFLRWIVGVATAHWDACASSSMRLNYRWVATRHEIDYRREALLGDAILARTWVGTADSRRFERFTVILRTTDNQVLARGRSLWTLLARDTGKVTRIPGVMVELFQAYAQQA